VASATLLAFFARQNRRSIPLESQWLVQPLSLPSWQEHSHAVTVGGDCRHVRLSEFSPFPHIHAADAIGRARRNDDIE